MARKTVIAIAMHGNDHTRLLGGQAAVLPFIADTGADGVEICRRLYSAEELNALPSLAAIVERHGLLACYSASQALLVDNGELNPGLPALLAGTQALNAPWLELSLGRFLHSQQLDELREILHDSGMTLTVESDQTDYNQLAPIQRSKATYRAHQLPVTLTFDTSNWLWVDDSPEETARHPTLAVSYIHVKVAKLHYEKFHTVSPDRAADRWLALLDDPPADAPRGIESPLTGHDLTAVTHRYINLLHED